jgi:hypothetical protein
VTGPIKQYYNRESNLPIFTKHLVGYGNDIFNDLEPPSAIAGDNGYSIEQDCLSKR